MPAGWRRSIGARRLRRSIWPTTKGRPIHVFADETRPRNQGASLTAWELGHHGVPHTVIADNTGGHLMQHGLVDMVIVGADRVTAQGDVCNKIGTYLKALAAHDNEVPFYVALPSPTIDFTVTDGLAEIPIEQRAAEEVATVAGKTKDGRLETVQVVPDGSPVANYAFDVTPARLVTGLITERGLIAANRAASRRLFPNAPKSGQSQIARSADGIPVYVARFAHRRPPVGNRACHRARHRAAVARAWTLRGERIAAAVRPPRRSRRARSGLANSGSSKSNPRSPIFAPTRNGRTTARIATGCFSPRRSRCLAKSSRPIPG